MELQREKRQGIYLPPTLGMQEKRRKKNQSHIPKYNDMLYMGMNVKVCQGNPEHLTLPPPTLTIRVMVQEFRVFDIEKDHLCFCKVSIVSFYTNFYVFKWQVLS